MAAVEAKAGAGNPAGCAGEGLAAAGRIWQGAVHYEAKP